MPQRRAPDDVELVTFLASVWKYSMTNCCRVWLVENSSTLRTHRKQISVPQISVVRLTFVTVVLSMFVDDMSCTSPIDMPQQCRGRTSTQQQRSEENNSLPNRRPMENVWNRRAPSFDTPVNILHAVARSPLPWNTATRRHAVTQQIDWYRVKRACPHWSRKNGSTDLGSFFPARYHRRLRGLDGSVRLRISQSIVANLSAEAALIWSGLTPPNLRMKLA